MENQTSELLKNFELPTEQELSLMFCLNRDKLEDEAVVVIAEVGKWTMYAADAAAIKNEDKRRISQVKSQEIESIRKHNEQMFPGKKFTEKAIDAQAEISPAYVEVVERHAKSHHTHAIIAGVLDALHKKYRMIKVLASLKLNLEI